MEERYHERFGWSDHGGWARVTRSPENPGRIRDTLTDSTGKQGWSLIALVLVLSAAHFATFFDPERSIVGDLSYFLYFAWRIGEGAIPHLDLFDNKTFLASYAGALLHRLGDGLGVDPLTTIRAGYLGLCALGGPLAFLVFRRLGGREPVAGLLGFFAYLSFGLLGALAAVGNVPKLIMALCAPAMALLVQDRRWLSAGFVGAVAFLDWQVGALVWGAAFAGALVHGAPRLRACLRVTLGGALGVAPLAAWYAMHGALGSAFDQIFVAAWSRGVASLGDASKPWPVFRILEQVTQTCTEHEWLFFVGVLGLAILPCWLWMQRGTDTQRLLLPLSLYHYGVVSFSLIDFQRYGDFFLLLHSMAFFLGLVWLTLYAAAKRWSVGRRQLAVPAVILALALVAARPGPLRPEVVLSNPQNAPPGVTLSDQRRVAEEVRERTKTGTLVVIENSELLFLMHQVNPLPVIYWNAAAYSYYGDAPNEGSSEAAMRMLLSVEPDAFVWTRRVPMPRQLREAFAPQLVGTERNMVGRGHNGYRIQLMTRKPSPAHP